MPPGTDAPLLSSLTGRLNEIFEFTLEAEAGTVDLMTLRDLAEFEVKNRLLAVPGVAAVERLGGHLRQYQVQLDPDRASGRGVTLEEVIHALEGANENAAAGIVVQGSMEWTVRAVGRIASLDDLRNTVVTVRGTTPVLLGDVATVVEAPAVRRGIAHRLKGEVVSCRVTKQFGADTVVVARGHPRRDRRHPTCATEGRHAARRLRPVAARPVGARRRRPRGADRRLPGGGDPVPASRRLEGRRHRHHHHPAFDGPGGDPPPLRQCRHQHDDPRRPRHRRRHPRRRRDHRDGEHHPSAAGARRRPTERHARALSAAVEVGRPDRLRHPHRDRRVPSAVRDVGNRRADVQAAGGGGGRHGPVRPRAGPDHRARGRGLAAAAARRRAPKATRRSSAV